MNDNQQQSMHKWYPWIAWLLGAMFFALQYFPRVGPSVMGEELMLAFKVSAAGLGGLTVFYMIGYVGMQLPIGLILDRFSTRRSMLTAIFSVVVGCLIFASSKTVYMAELGRLLMGAGAAFSFIGAIKIATDWFSTSTLGMLAGLTQTFGMGAAAIADAPLSEMVEAYGWRSSMYAVAIALFVLMVVMFFVIRDHKSDKHRHAIEQEKFGFLMSLMTVLRNKQNWINGAYLGLVFAPTMAFAELWGVPFLQQAYHLTKSGAALANGFIFIGWAVGGPLFGWASDKMGKRRPAMLLSAVTGFILISAVIYMPALSVTQLSILLFLFGFSNAGVAVAYAVSGEINRHEVTGTSVAFGNMASIIIGSFLQPIIGFLLDSNWTGELTAKGIRVYSTHDYHLALLVFPIGLLVSIFFVLILKETNCKMTDHWHHPVD
jgi:MFS family permease